MQQVLGVALLTVSAAFTAAVQAADVDVTYTVSGSPGSWDYDFSVTNNLPGDFEVYSLEVFVTDGTGTGSPAGWVQQPHLSPHFQWCHGNCLPGTGIVPGETLGGFLVNSSFFDVFVELEVHVEAFSPTTQQSSTYDGVARTPEPSALALLGLGLAGLAASRRRKLG